MNIEKQLHSILKRDIDSSTDNELYFALSVLTEQYAPLKPSADKKKKLYYLSAEYLPGKLLSNNLINLGLFDEVRKVLSMHGKSLSDIEALEAEPSLGNGGLGRLAACFADSVATLGLNGDFFGLCYHFGLFRQRLENNTQREFPDTWLRHCFYPRKTEVVYETELNNMKLRSRMYNIPVVGYGKKVRTLHLFDLESVSDTLVEKGITFDRGNLQKNLTLFLYPDDSDETGKLLRLCQQYFMVSSAASYILEECIKKGCNLYDLYDYAVIQINDTHPAMIIPELIRRLMAEGLTFDTAVTTVTKVCAYTNHTIMAEALEKWPLHYFQKVLPQLYPIIKMLDEQIRRRFSDETVYITDRQNNVYMASLAIHFGFSVNGVARLHTEILKNSELKNFYAIYPEKFNNKTNGITPRRWLLKSNPELCGLIEELIGDGYKENAEELLKLEKYLNDQEVLERLLKIKLEKKEQLRTLLKKKQGIFVDCFSVFDIQAKRLHEYKRQQLNCLWLIDRYLKIKAGFVPSYPVTVIFAAKAAPSYELAKDIIHLILCFSELLDNEPSVKKHLNTVMLENYNVSSAEVLIPSCDISEQLSLASTEASGTGNMKFMMNGAVTLGTNDGANVEIAQLVRNDNIYIFGQSSDEVIHKQKNGGYNPNSLYSENPSIKRAVDFLTSPQLLKYGFSDKLSRLSHELKNNDRFMTLADFDDYLCVKDRMLDDFEDRFAWAKKMLVNISRSGFFSSDRTVNEYNRDIWKL